MGAGIYFSSVTGNTEEIADLIGEVVGADPADIDDMTATAIADQNPIFVGAPTWNTGAEDNRTGSEMDEFMYKELLDLDLTGKTVSVFGCGDAVGYSDNFCDAIEEMHDRFAAAGATMVGYTDPGLIDPEFAASKSVRDGKFLGLPVDKINGDEDENEDKVKAWAEEVMSSV